MEAGYPGCPPYPKVMDIPSSIGDTLAPGKITKGGALQLQDLLRAKRLGRAEEKDKQKANNLLGLSPHWGLQNPSCSRERGLLSLGAVFLIRSCAETAGRREGRGWGRSVHCNRGCWAPNLPGAA